MNIARTTTPSPWQSRRPKRSPFGFGIRPRLRQHLRFFVSVVLLVVLMLTFQFLPVEGFNTPKQILIRLEDIGPGGQYDSPEQLGKLAAVLDFLYEQGVAYEIAVVPRWINILPDGTRYDKSIDQAGTDPLIGEFVGLLHRAEQRGGVIGMHGYTHQVGSVRRDDGQHESAIGNEFKVDGVAETKTAAFADRRVREGLDVFRRAGFEPHFWEAPHYRTTPDQDAVFRSYFGLSFQGNVNAERNPKQVQYTSTRNLVAGSDAPTLGAVYVPTPMSYIPYNKDASLILKQLDKEDRLKSFFYHPFLEFKHLAPVLDEQGGQVFHNGLPAYEYPAKERTNLQKLITGIRQKGFSFVSIHDLIPFTPAQSLDLGAPGADIAVGRVRDIGQAGVVRWDHERGLFTVQYGHFRGTRSETSATTTTWLRLPYERGDAFTLFDGNGDGRDDLWVLRRSGELSSYRSTGEAFVYVRSWSLPFQGWSQMHAFRAGQDGWGLAGMAQGNGQMEGVYIRGDDVRAIAPKTWGKKPPDRVQVCDLDGDGVDSLAFPVKKSGKLLQLTLDTASLQWKTETVPLDGPTGLPGEMWFGDFNGDGRQGILFWDPEEQSYTIYQAVGKLRYSYLGSMGPWGKKNAKLIVYDFDGNGKQDIALLGGDDPYLDIALSYQSATKGPEL